MIDQHEASPRGRALPERPVALEEAARRLGQADGAWRAAARAFPVRWPAGYLALAEGPHGEPVRRMGVPEAAELVPDPGDRPDPVGERLRHEAPCIVRKHRDRVILLVTARCHFYCRFCFRRSFPDGGHADPSREELERALEHVASEPEIREVILSGGDPLVLPDERLAELVRSLSAIPHVTTLRVHTRAPVHEPARVTPALARVLSSGKPLWLVTHFNHAVELTEDSRAALATLAGAGIPLANQSVLLAGVNDDAQALARLVTCLLEARVKPYYLHHLDRVPGSARFRVPIERGLAIHADLARQVSGLALPAYVIDLPDGSGKIPVASLERVGPGRWRAPHGFELDE
jgi:lysine 2,3-aminomutase